LSRENKGVQQKMAKPTHFKRRHRHEPNTDLDLEYWDASKNLNWKVNRAKGHQDTKTLWEALQYLAQLQLSTNLQHMLMRTATQAVLYIGNPRMVYHM
jgi:hypothetical protein